MRSKKYECSVAFNSHNHSYSLSLSLSHSIDVVIKTVLEQCKIANASTNEPKMKWLKLCAKRLFHSCCCYCCCCCCCSNINAFAPDHKMCSTGNCTWRVHEWAVWLGAALPISLSLSLSFCRTDTSSIYACACALGLPGSWTIGQLDRTCELFSTEPGSCARSPPVIGVRSISFFKRLLHCGGRSSSLPAHPLVSMMKF